MHFVYCYYYELHSFLFVFVSTFQYNECTMSSLFQLFLWSYFVFTRFIFVIFPYFISEFFLFFLPARLSVCFPILDAHIYIFNFKNFHFLISLHVILLFLLVFIFSFVLNLFKTVADINFICIVSHVHCALCTLKHNNIIRVHFVIEMGTCGPRCDHNIV